MLDGKGTVVSVFLADMLNTVIREIIEVNHLNMTEPVFYRGKAHLCLFLVVGITVILLSTIVNLCFICHGIHDAKIAAFKAILLAVQWVGAVLYYYGDNITYITEYTQNSLHWSKTVIDDCNKAANITLGLALVFHHFIAPLVIEAGHLFNAKSNEKAHSDGPKALQYRSHSGLNMIATFLTLDVIFTLATRTWITDLCDQTGSWIFIGLIGLTLLIVYSILSCRTWCSGCGVLLLAISLPVFLVADNPLPLDCPSNVSEQNASGHNASGYNASGHNILRLCLSIASFVVVLPAAISALYSHCRTLKKKKKGYKRVIQDRTR
jgi:hypothetical protein